MRRSGFPVAYSQGFNPRPRMAFASALTLGATSAWELCQLDLAEDIDRERLDQAAEALRAQLPSGMEVLEIWAIPLEKRNPYIQVRGAAYELTLSGEEAGPRARQFFEEGPGLVQALESAVEERPDGALLQIRLPAGERAGVRIRDVVAELEKAIPGLRVTRLHRARLWCELDPTADETEPTKEECGEAMTRAQPPEPE
jgi:hypothetical protein